MYFVGAPGTVVMLAEPVSVPLVAVSVVAPTIVLVMNVTVARPLALVFVGFVM